MFELKAKVTFSFGNEKLTSNSLQNAAGLLRGFFYDGEDRASVKRNAAWR